MSEDSSQVQIFFSDEFQARLRTLARRYRQIRFDLQPLLDDLKAGNFNGDQISGIGYTVFKVRLRNSDIQKGKSAGYRIIYQVKNSTCILLVVIYSKSDQSNIAAEKIRAIIDNFKGSDT